MKGSKIRLSEDELQLVQNPHILLTKNRIIEKVNQLFAKLAGEYQYILEHCNSSEIIESRSILPKISKGENYQGLPYLMLDYPRVFSKDNVFAVRTMFWWGHYFSITLHIKGVYKAQLLHRITSWLQTNRTKGFYINETNNEWEHDLTGTHYCNTGNLTWDQLHIRISSREFLKIATMIPLVDWDYAESFLIGAFAEMARAIEA